MTIMSDAPMTRKGHCHCGAVQFTATFPDGELRGSRCNCSICAMKGAVMVYIPLEDLTVTKGEDALNCYSFNTGAAKHYFCSHCGIHCFHQARSDPDKYAINAACLDGVSPYDFAELRVNDGIHHQLDNDGVVRTAGWLRYEANPED